jgi:hypothetical protein
VQPPKVGRPSQASKATGAIDNNNGADSPTVLFHIDRTLSPEICVESLFRLKQMNRFSNRRLAKVTGFGRNFIRE